mmetsp:Transcript_16395/g.31854  ORF Transcript_16395/g.31854 Transcript_16395/m.31854 type:complete len:251 (-) Transcript_16395:868-1620(-)
MLTAPLTSSPRSRRLPARVKLVSLSLARNSSLTTATCLCAPRSSRLSCAFPLLSASTSVSSFTTRVSSRSRPLSSLVAARRVAVRFLRPSTSATTAVLHSPLSFTSRFLQLAVASSVSSKLALSSAQRTVTPHATFVSSTASTLRCASRSTTMRFSTCSPTCSSTFLTASTRRTRLSLRPSATTSPATPSSTVLLRSSRERLRLLVQRVTLSCSPLQRELLSSARTALAPTRLRILMISPPRSRSALVLS